MTPSNLLCMCEHPDVEHQRVTGEQYACTASGCDCPEYEPMPLNGVPHILDSRPDWVQDYRLNDGALRSLCAAAEATAERLLVAGIRPQSDDRGRLVSVIRRLVRHLWTERHAAHYYDKHVRNMQQVSDIFVGAPTTPEATPTVPDEMDEALNDGFEAVERWRAADEAMLQHEQAATEALCEAMQRTHLSLREVARRTKLSPAALSSVMRGQLNNLSSDATRRVLTVLKEAANERAD